MNPSKVSRRKFLAFASSLSASAFAKPALAAVAKDNSLLLEAASFANKGGWRMDTQFHNVLGFTYLLAHGMGHAVSNARTKVQFPSKGRYHVWVHTKDWCPGEWEAPGRFQVEVDGKLIDATFGTRKGWGWQTGGVIDIQNTQTLVELVDLTGFEGRCSAIYFSQDPSDAPPTELKELKAWRREKNGIPTEPSETLDFDLVIAGGGMSGCAAAIAAESQGLKVALIQDRPVLGGNASSEIRVHTEGIHGNAEEIISQIDTPHYPNGSPAAHEADRKRHEALEAARGVQLFLSHGLIDAKADGKRIQSVDAIEFETGLERRFKADLFIDATGDGWIGAKSGATFRYGRESKHEFDEEWAKHGELWSPEVPDNRVMGTSILFRSERTRKPKNFPEVPWAMPVAKDLPATQGTWHWEYSDNDLHQIDDAEQIRDHMFRAVYGSFSNAKKQPENAPLELQWVSFVSGKRESRRIEGDHIYSMKDASESREFPDAVVKEKRAIDVHYQQKLQGHPNDFLSEALFARGKMYYIPFRSLYSKDIDNLMMAGRCFSCTHIGLGGPRVMNTCAQMGVATGFAAGIARRENATPREVGQNHIAALRKLCGFAS
ncbi:MAG: FAD-dependent oxidoreductase [Verrucomicrobiota bacterium]